MQILKLLTGALAALALLAPAAQAGVGPDYVASDNVELVKSIKLPDGLTAGARIVGRYLYVTSGKDLEIYDISKPEDPQQVGGITLDVQFENEEVPTNGRILGISSDTFSSGLACIAGDPTSAGSCLRLWDVRDPANPKELAPVLGAGAHIQGCALDCSYMYGSDGSIVDLRGALDGKPATIVGNWKDAVASQYEPKGSCHAVREIRRGIMFTACQPFALLSINPEDGGSPLAPVVLATGGNADGRFIHSNRWPRGGADKFALVGGETNFQPQCGPTRGAFMTFDASEALKTGQFTGPLDEIRPKNGTYADGNPPANALGCSVHWFEEHPNFRNGGLVALAEYEQGSRFLQITPKGKIVEQGYFEPLGGSTSALHWVPGTDIVYAIDYERGIDVLRWKGDDYVPGRKGIVRHRRGRVRGTNGRQPVLPALTPRQRRAGLARVRMVRALQRG